MITCKNVQKYFPRRDVQLLTVAIGESLGDSIQRGSRRGGRGYLDKYITHKHQRKGILFSHFGKPYSMSRVVLI